jgi:uncharacterized protein
MTPDSILQPKVVSAALLLLLPLLLSAFMPGRVPRIASALPKPARIAAPALLSLAYLLVAQAFHNFHWGWMALYALIGPAIAWLLGEARENAGSRGKCLDFLVLALLGLAVDLRWLEPAWPPGLAAFGKILLLDAGIYAFHGVRKLEGVGFDLHFTRSDLMIGLREFLLYALIAIPLGLGLGFLSIHKAWPEPLHALGAFVFTFLFIAIPEDLYFRGWLQNLLERRLGRSWALVATAAIFGLAHWNKRTTSFNWRYVLMAAVAGIFYGRAWRARRRVCASSLTHATVDTVWGLWLR